MGCHMVSLSELGFAAILALNLLVGAILISFSVTLPPFLTLGLVSGWEGLNWIPVDWGFGPNFPSNSKNVLIFLMIVGWGQSLVLHGVHLINLVVLSLLNTCVPCIEVIFTSMSTALIGRWHLKKPCRKLHLGLKCRPSEIKALKFYSGIYTTSGISDARVNHVIPCFIFT